MQPVHPFGEVYQPRPGDASGLKHALGSLSSQLGSLTSQTSHHRTSHHTTTTGVLNLVLALFFLSLNLSAQPHCTNWHHSPQSTNGFEYFESFGRIASWSPPLSNEFTFQFFGESNRTYVVQSKTVSVSLPLIVLRRQTNEYGGYQELVGAVSGTPWVDCTTNIQGRGEMVTFKSGVPFERCWFRVVTTH